MTAFYLYLQKVFRLACSSSFTAPLKTKCPHVEPHQPCSVTQREGHLEHCKAKFSMWAVETKCGASQSFHCSKAKGCFDLGKS